MSLSVLLRCFVAVCAAIGSGQAAATQPTPADANRRPQAPASPLAASDRRGELLEAKLREPCEIFIAKGTPLGEAVQVFERQSGIGISPEWTLLAHSNAVARVEIDSPNSPASEALEELLSPHRLVAFVRDGNVVVARARDYRMQDEYLETRLYRCADLATDDESNKTLINVLRASLTNAAWRDESGFGGEIRSLIGTLVIRQTQRSHAEIESTLNMIRAAVSAEPSEGAGLGVFSRDGDRTIEARLREPLEIQIPEGTTLKAAFAEIASKTDIVIRPDWDGALADEAIDPDLPVQCASSGSPARDVLELIWRPLQLAGMTRRGHLSVTTQIALQQSGEFVETRVYRCNSLMGDNQAIRRLANLLQKSVKNARWERVNGQDVAISYLRGLIVVSQTQRVHAQIEATLETVCQSRSDNRD